MSWIRVCSTADVPANSIRRFEVAGGIKLLIVNYGDGFRVLPPVCPHMEEPLEVSGLVASCMLTCTKHLWSWDLRTLDMQGETEKPLRPYDSKVENGDVLAFVDKEIVYEFDSEDDMDDDDFFK